MRSISVRKQILIWGKTYPELSSKYFETVCTAGVTEDGQPLRLYPIPFRYLSQQFEKYQWISADIYKNPSDNRPESYKIDCDSIELGLKIPSTSDEWGKRAAILFQDAGWQFKTVDELLAAQRTKGTSLGVLTPRKILKIEIANRDNNDFATFDEKFQGLKNQLEARRSQLTLFEQTLPPEMKQLDFLKSRMEISWLCENADCNGHKMQILDWEICELQRRDGDKAALAKMQELTDLKKYRLRFFLGSLFLYQQSFTIIGLWYPKLADLLFH